MRDTTRLPRITVAAVVPDGDRYLLVEELIDERLVLNQPAGHLDPDESLIDAVIRETREETAWTVRPVGLIGIYQLLLPHVHFVRMSFLCEALQHDPAQALDKEIVRTHWLTRDEIASHSVPQRSSLVLRCIDDHIAGRLWPLEQIVEPVR
ncbi:MAG TPA: NUDIX hydrolase [Xanthomonadales bacterium]|nr:NUDIX hydrolase [Xanthomonadales bacterium]